LNLFAGHLFGGVDGVEHRFLDPIHVDDRSRPHAFRNLMAKSRHVETVVIAGLGDETADFRRTDIQGGNRAVS
jgi:hypothetical protein